MNAQNFVNDRKMDRGAGLPPRQPPGRRFESANHFDDGLRMPSGTPRGHGMRPQIPSFRGSLFPEEPLGRRQDSRDRGPRREQIYHPMMQRQRQRAREEAPDLWDDAETDDLQDGPFGPDPSRGGRNQTVGDI